MIQENTFGIIVLLIATASLPILAVTVTAFAKIAIVIFLVRNALGVQQLPPNIVLYSLSVILAAYISAPVITDAFAIVADHGFSFRSFEEWRAAGQAAAVPLTTFLTKHANPDQVSFFQESAVTIWGDRYAATATDPSSLQILVPSFMLSELTRAFEIGFLLYLPFVAIDLIVTTVLVALGMMMVPPTTVSIPFKLMLFVFLDGWTKVVQGLILSYA